MAVRASLASRSVTVDESVAKAATTSAKRTYQLGMLALLSKGAARADSAGTCATFWHDGRTLARAAGLNDRSYVEWLLAEKPNEVQIAA